MTIVTGEMVEDYARDGVVIVRGLFADWVETLRAGVEKNMADPSPQLMATLKPGEKGRFFDDYCNWTRIPNSGRQSAGRAWRVWLPP